MRVTFWLRNEKKKPPSLKGLKKVQLTNDDLMSSSLTPNMESHYW